MGLCKLNLSHLERYDNSHCLGGQDDSTSVSTGDGRTRESAGDGSAGSHAIYISKPAEIAKLVQQTADALA